MKVRLLQGAAIAALASVIAPTAWAQSGNVQVAQAGAVQSVIDPGYGGGLETVVVSAEKRETDLQKTPIAISVVSPAIMEDRHVTSLLDLNDGAIPGLRVATFEARQSALTIGIRGIVPLDANQPAREQGVGVYIDGVYLARQQGLNAALLDVERIEVLKGPQGTLFGRNTEGGALSIVTRAPTGEFGLRAVAGGGNFGSYNSELHLNLPSFFNIATKIDAIIQHQDPTTADPLPGSVGWNYYNRKGVRFGARWEPIESLRVDYSFDYAQDENTPFYSQLLNYNPNNLVIGPATGTLPAGQIRPLPAIVQVKGTERMRVADIGVPQQPSVDIITGHALSIAWDAMEHLQLRSITAYRNVFTDQWDNSGGAHRIPQFTSGGAFSRYSLSQLWQHQFTQEFQAVGDLFENRVQYVAGFYYFQEKAQEEAATPSTNTWSATGIPTATSFGYTINDPTPTIPGLRSLDRASFAYSKSTAIYGQFTYTPPVFDDILHLTFGGRYTADNKKGTLYKVSNAVTNLPFVEKDSRFNPMVTLAVDVTPDVNLYAKYASGYRAGGASSRSLTFRSFGPEDVDSYEIGFKTEWFDMLRFNGALYTMDRTGSQIDFSLVTVVGAATRNTLEAINAPGVTKITGVELEAEVNLAPGLNLSGSYAYTFTKIPPTLNPFNNTIQPVFIVFTPKNAFSAAIDYTFPMDWAALRLHLDGNYADATQTFDQTPVTNDASFLMNARVALSHIELGNQEGTDLELAFWVRNMWDNTFVYRRDPANRATLGDYGNFNAPRTFGLEARVAL